MVYTIGIRTVLSYYILYQFIPILLPDLPKGACSLCCLAKRAVMPIAPVATSPADILDSVFRGVQVSDSAPIDNDKLILTGHTLISPLSAARVEDFDGDAKDLPLYQECVRPGETIRFRLTLDQSILNRHIHPITKDALLTGVSAVCQSLQLMISGSKSV